MHAHTIQDADRSMLIVTAVCGGLQARSTTSPRLGERSRQVGGQLQDCEALRCEELSDCLRTACGVANVVRAFEGPEMDAVLCGNTPLKCAADE